MPLKVGDEAPDINAVASDGQRVQLRAMRGRVVVLYFYPGDFTPVCTKEACGFRDHYEEFKTSSTVLIGVSLDSDASHTRFAEAHRLPFPLIADTDHSIARRYAALGPLGRLFHRAQRVTYVIDREGTIAGVVTDVFRASAHLDGVRALVTKLTAGS